MVSLAVCAVALVGCRGDESRDASPTTSTAVTVPVTTPEITTALEASPPEERYATIVADGPMFRLDHIWYCDASSEECSWTAALTEGVLEVFDGCLYIVPSGADPERDRILYLGLAESRWDATGPGAVRIWESTYTVGEEVAVGGNGMNVERYLDMYSVREFPTALLECAARGNGEILMTPPYFTIVD